MIHTIPNPVKLFLGKHNKQLAEEVATTWNTDSMLREIT